MKGIDRLGVFAFWGTCGEGVAGVVHHRYLQRPFHRGALSHVGADALSKLLQSWTHDAAIHGSARRATYVSWNRLGRATPL